MRKLSALACGLSLIALLLAVSARAQNMIPASEDVGAIPGFGGSGLDGVYYDNLNGFSSDTGFAPTATAGTAPEATFISSNLCFPDCHGTGFSDGNGGLVAFTNGNATNIVFNTQIEAPRTSWNSSELDFSGYIAITTPGTYSFNLNSDDGSYIGIGGNPLTQGSQQDTFTQAGLYKINVQFFEQGGGSLLDLTGTDPNGMCIFGCYDSNQNLESNDLFYTAEDLPGAPAPVIGGGLPAMVIAGLMGIGAVLRRRATV